MRVPAEGTLYMKNKLNDSAQPLPIAVSVKLQVVELLEIAGSPQRLLDLLQVFDLVRQPGCRVHLHGRVHSDRLLLVDAQEPIQVVHLRLGVLDELAVRQEGFLRAMRVHSRGGALARGTQGRQAGARRVCGWGAEHGAPESH